MDIKSSFINMINFKTHIFNLNDKPENFVFSEKDDGIHVSFSYGVVQYDVRLGRTITECFNKLDLLTNNIIEDFKAEDRGDLWREQ